MTIRFSILFSVSYFSFIIEPFPNNTSSKNPHCLIVYFYQKCKMGWWGTFYLCIKIKRYEKYTDTRASGGKLQTYR